jgi:hypothetical protein
MSRITDTKRAYQRLSKMLDKELVERRGDTKELEQFRQTMDAAFYLLAWARFEYLVRKEAEEVVDQHASSKGIDGHSWRYFKENIKSVSVRKRLEVILHAEPKTLQALDKEYTFRNDIAHDNKQLPKEVGGVEAWIVKLEDVIEKLR